MKTRARVLLPNRGQMEFRASDLESVLPAGHRARLVWANVERQDLTRFYAGTRAVDGGVGRAEIAPEILLALWLYATLEGVGSARQVSRLIESHDAYRWLCGGVQVNHYTLSDFRKDHGEALDELLSVSIASLMAAGVVKLRQVAQDGMRVRASAGAGSFRRQEKLEGFLTATRRSSRPPSTPSCMTRCPRPRTRRSMRTKPRPATATRWRRGERAWARTKRRPSTSGAPPRPNASMRRRATAAYCSSGCAGWTRSST